ncbi:antirestriction protein ArdC [Azospirillum brasilense]|nr:antirestriction protein ArdC [Azospirillum brasilense]
MADRLNQSGPDKDRKSFADRVAEKLIDAMEKGTAPWQKPWSAGTADFLPHNPTTGKRYRGINALMLSAQGRDDTRWMTYNQAQTQGAQVRKGERGTPVQFWQYTDRQERRDEQGKPVLDPMTGKPVMDEVKLERPRVFTAVVFNGEQIDGLPPPADVRPVTWNPIEKAEAILAASGADIRHSNQGGAFYAPGRDFIQLPHKEHFAEAAGYYATALHELGHWTGHPSRLERDLAHPFGSEGYAKEELRAEIASMILGNDLAIGHDPGQHAAYVQSWIKALKDDPMEIFRAAADAEKIATYVVGLEQRQEQQKSISFGIDHPIPNDGQQYYARVLSPNDPGGQTTSFHWVEGRSSWKTQDEAVEAFNSHVHSPVHNHLTSDEALKKALVNTGEGWSLPVGNGIMCGVAVEPGATVREAVADLESAEGVSAPDRVELWIGAAPQKANLAAGPILDGDVFIPHERVLIAPLAQSQKASTEIAAEPLARTSSLTDNGPSKRTIDGVAAQSTAVRLLTALARRAEAVADAVTTAAARLASRVVNLHPPAVLSASLERAGVTTFADAPPESTGPIDDALRESAARVAQGGPAIDRAMRLIDPEGARSGPGADAGDRAAAALAAAALGMSGHLHLDQPQPLAVEIAHAPEAAEPVAAAPSRDRHRDGLQPQAKAVRLLTDLAQRADLAGDAHTAETVRLASRVVNQHPPANLSASLERAGFNLFAGYPDAPPKSIGPAEDALRESAGRVGQGGPVIDRATRLLDPEGTRFASTSDAGDPRAMALAVAALTMSGHLHLDQPKALTVEIATGLAPAPTTGLAPTPEAAEPVVARPSRERHRDGLEPQAKAVRLLTDLAQRADLAGDAHTAETVRLASRVVSQQPPANLSVSLKRAGFNTFAGYPDAAPQSTGPIEDALRESAGRVEQGGPIIDRATRLLDPEGTRFASGTDASDRRAMALAVAALTMSGHLHLERPQPLAVEIAAGLDGLREAPETPQRSIDGEAAQETAAKLLFDLALRANIGGDLVSADSVRQSAYALQRMTPNDVLVALERSGVHGNADSGLSGDSSQDSLLVSAARVGQGGPIIDRATRLLDPEGVRSGLGGDMADRRAMALAVAALTMKGHIDLSASEPAAIEIAVAPPVHTPPQIDRAQVDADAARVQEVRQREQAQALNAAATTEDAATMRNERRDVEAQATQNAERQQSAERTYINVPFTEKNEAKDMGAKWDRAAESWYVPAGADAAKFAKWPTHSPAPKSDRTYLAVPYAERNDARSLGAQWDGKAKSWYAPPTAQLAQLAKWLPENVERQQAPALDPRSEFAQILKGLDMAVDGDHPIPDGKTHRIRLNTDKGKETSGFYVFHLDEGRPAGYARNNRTGDETRWKAKGYHLDSTDRAKLAAQAAVTQQRRAKELDQQYERVAQETEARLTGLKPVSDSEMTPYLAQKRVTASSGVYRDGDATVVPAIDVTGKVWTAQTIGDPALGGGTVKSFAKGGKKSGTFHPLGGMAELAKAPAIIIAEGYATAASLRDGGNFATVCAFDAGNMPAVAKALAEHFPTKPIILAADENSIGREGKMVTVGRDKAQEAADAVGGTVMLPVFRNPTTGSKGLTDFNDMANQDAYGREAVARSVKAAVQIAHRRQAERAPQAQQQDQSLQRGKVLEAVGQANTQRLSRGRR